MRDESRKRKLKKILIILGSILLMLILGLGTYKVFAQSTLTNIEIEAENLTCTDIDSVKDSLRNLKINYFSYQSEVVERTLQQKFFCIGKVETRVSYPDKLKVKLLDRVPVFSIKVINTGFQPNPEIDLDLNSTEATESTREAVAPKILKEIIDTYREASGSGEFLVDENGVVFDKSSGESTVPRLSIFAKNLRVGETIPDDLIGKSFKIYNKLKELETVSDNLLVVGDRLIIDSNPRITFSLKNGIERQTASLQLILSQAKMNLDPEKGDIMPVESIDLRFDKPVVVYSKKIKN